MSKIVSRKPAECWEEAYPIGNGRFGAMVSGGYEEDHLWLNEDSIWYGGPRDRVNPEARGKLEEVRKLIFSGRPDEAQEVLRYSFTAIPESQRIYQPLADCLIHMNGEVPYQSCSRELDLETAVCIVLYETEKGGIRKEYVASFPDQLIAVRFEALGEQRLNFDVKLERQNFQNTVMASETGKTEIFLKGDLGKDGLDYVAGAAVYVEREMDAKENNPEECGKKLLKADLGEGTAEVRGEYLVVRNAKKAVLLLSGTSTFYEKNPQKYVEELFTKAQEKGYEKLKTDHIADYRRLFGTNRLQLMADDAGNADAQTKQDEEKQSDGFTTEERLERVRKGEADLELITTYYDFGRYLLIASSRPGSLPATLQGIWNHRIQPPWESKYTININTEMNYWPAMECGLGECVEPLTTLLERMKESGRKTADEMYGCRGFLAHHNTDIWADTAPQDTYIPATYWVMGAAWLSLVIWEYYEYTLDQEWLEKHYDTLEQAVLFFHDYLVEDQGEYVTCPSVSPENTYIMENGTHACVCAGPTMDNEILTDLFGAYLKASEILGRQNEITERTEKIKKKLPKIQIGKYGQIMEWREDYEEQEPGHRHISQLYGLFPSDQFNWETPELLQAAENTLERRLSHGGGHTGWSAAWLINLYARLGKGQRAHEMLRKLLSESTFDTLMDNHPHVLGPVFQIDGNLGGVSGIFQMLVQDYNHKVRILPACPKEWKRGSFRGIWLKGNAVLSFSFNEEKVFGSICARSDWDGKLILGEKEVKLSIKAGEEREFSIERI